MGESSGSQVQILSGSFYKMKVLFVCRHNRFRSKVAEALFNNYNKNKRNEAQSRGVKRDLPYVAPLVKKILKEYGIDKVDNTPKFIDDKIINWADKIVVAADNVSAELFKDKDVEIWKVQDCDQDDEEGIRLRVKHIDERVKELVKRLKK